MRYFLLYVLAVNILSFVIFFADKMYARKRMLRVSENTLMLTVVFGGGIGALMSMQIFRHKTRHGKFTVGIPIIVLIQFLILYLVSFSQ